MATNKFNKTSNQAFTPAPLSKHYLATLSEQPVISPAFCGTLALAADNQVHRWIVANAPTAIANLYRGAMNLRSYEGEFEDGHGLVSRDANSSILGTVAEVINSLDHLDDEWIITTP